MEGKTVKESQMTMVIQMNPEDANPVGNVHGGVIMKYVDTAAGAVAIRHARKNCVTASIDRLDFHNPVFVGDLLILKASITLVGKTSMEVGVRVEAEDLSDRECTAHSVSLSELCGIGPKRRTDPGAAADPGHRRGEAPQL